MLTSDLPSFRLGKYKPVRNNKNDQDQATQFVDWHVACGTNGWSVYIPGLESSVG